LTSRARALERARERADGRVKTHAGVVVRSREVFRAVTVIRGIGVRIEGTELTVWDRNARARRDVTARARSRRRRRRRRPHTATRE